MKGRCLALRDLHRLAEHLARRCLIKPRPQTRFTDRLENANRADRRDVRRVLGDIEADAHVALRAEVINLIRPQFVEQFDQVDRIAEVAVVQEQMRRAHMRVLVEMVNAFGVERAGATDNPVHLVALGEKKLRQIRTVLPRDPRDERAFHGSQRSMPCAAGARKLEPIRPADFAFNSPPSAGCRRPTESADRRDLMPAGRD